jgi:hypothetical protein
MALKNLRYFMLYLVYFILITAGGSCTLAYSETSVLADNNFTPSNFTENPSDSTHSLIIKTQNTNPTSNITAIIGDKLYIKITYTKLFRVDNLLYPYQKIDVDVYYNLSKMNKCSIDLGQEISLGIGTDNCPEDIILNNGTYSVPVVLQKNSFHITALNKYKASDTGELLIDSPGRYELCGAVFYNGSLQDTTCKSIEVLDIASVECDQQLELNIIDKTNKTADNIYENNDKLNFEFGIKEKASNSSDSQPNLPFEFEYWIIDIFGDMIREKTRSSTLEKQFTVNNKRDLDILYIEGAVYSYCNDSNLSNNNVSETIMVFNKNSNIMDKDINQSSATKSLIKILNVYNENKLKFGSSVEVKLEVTKVNTAKHSLQAYVEDSDGKKVSEITKLSVFGTFFSQELSIYVKLKDSKGVCSNRYYLVVEGLDSKDMQILNIDCIEEKQSEEKQAKEKESKQSSKTSSKTSSSKKISKKSASDKTHVKNSDLDSGSDSYSNSSDETLFSAPDESISKLVNNAANKCDMYKGTAYSIIGSNSTLDIVYKSSTSRIKSNMQYFIISLLLISIITMFIKQKM